MLRYNIKHFFNKSFLVILAILLASSYSDVFAYNTTIIVPQTPIYIQKRPNDAAIIGGAVGGIIGWGMGIWQRRKKIEKPSKD